MSKSQTGTSQGTAAAVAAWRSSIVAVASVTAELAAELRSSAGIDIQMYDILLHVYEAGPEGLRMSQLAAATVVSKSGLTSRVEKLAKRHWIDRVQEPGDRRAVRIVLTEAGEAKFRQAAKVHVAGIERLFGQALVEGDVDVIRSAMSRVVDGIDPSRNQ